MLLATCQSAQPSIAYDWAEKHMLQYICVRHYRHACHFTYFISEHLVAFIVVYRRRFFSMNSSWTSAAWVREKYLNRSIWKMPDSSRFSSREYGKQLCLTLLNLWSVLYAQQHRLWFLEIGMPGRMTLERFIQNHWLWLICRRDQTECYLVLIWISTAYHLEIVLRGVFFLCAYVCVARAGWLLRHKREHEFCTSFILGSRYSVAVCVAIVCSGC